MIAERDNAVATGSPTSTVDNNVKSGRSGDSSKGGRKKYCIPLFFFKHLLR